MNSEYLNRYHVPIIAGVQNNVPLHLSTSPPSVLLNRNFIQDDEANMNRFTPPSKHGMSNHMAMADARPPKRKLQDEAPPLSTEKAEASKMVMFQGRDESYPDELNKLIQPLACQLCKVQLTSMRSAKDHYESKAHDRHISAWLAMNYTEAGLQSPAIKRMVKQGPTGPHAYHCALCDLSLTSLTHARQHYAGRKHRLVEQKRGKPSGAGHYTAEGKWVRTGTKLEATPDNRFGIAEQFPVPVQVPAQAVPVAKVTSEVTSEVAASSAVEDNLCCQICKISVTSANQMQMHIDGAKHQKKLRLNCLNGEDEPMPMSIAPPPVLDLIELLPVQGDPEGVDDAGMAMYRTPSGSYYCKLCNKLMNHASILQQHLMGKKHLKTVRQQSSNNPPISK